MTLRALWFAACVMAFATTASPQQPQQPTISPTVVLSRIQVSYPLKAESTRVTGTVSVRVDVLPHGSVAKTTVLEGVPVLSDAAVRAASRARFQCHHCPQPSTPHVITFVFAFDGSNNAGNPPPVAWKQTGDASSEVTVFGRALVLPRHPPERAARCLWLWHCG